jgi:hypothetical protein
VAFGDIHRGRWAAANIGVHELAGSPVDALLHVRAAARLVALLIL